MHKFKLFILGDGAIVALGLLFFIILYFRTRPSHFRDDLWNDVREKVKNKKPKNPEVAYRQREAAIDEQILLGHQPSEAEQEEDVLVFRPPNFHGAPHEVLGVDANSSREVIQAAYRHWMKRYHPDHVNHLGQVYIDQARRRAEQLNAARGLLLKKL